MLDKWKKKISTEENNDFIEFGRMFITLGSRLLLVGIGCTIVGLIITFF